MRVKLLGMRQDETEEKLTFLLKKCGYYLQQQQRSASNSKLREEPCFRAALPLISVQYCNIFTAESLKHAYTGFDWFASSVFLLMNGNKERSWKFLHKFSTLIASSYLWVQRLHVSVRCVRV